MAQQQNKDHDKKGMIDDLSDDAKRRTNNATSQADLDRPRITREDLPEADQKNFKHGKYAGTGTGAGPGGSTDTGGADTTTMQGQARTGTTDDLPNKNTSGASAQEGTDRSK